MSEQSLSILDAEQSARDEPEIQEDAAAQVDPSVDRPGEADDPAPPNEEEENNPVVREVAAAGFQGGNVPQGSPRLGRPDEAGDQNVGNVQHAQPREIPHDIPIQIIRLDEMEGIDLPRGIPGLEGPYEADPNVDFVEIVPVDELQDEMHMEIIQEGDPPEEQEGPDEPMPRRGSRSL